MLTWIPSPSPLDNVQFKNGKKISPFKSSHPLPFFSCQPSQKPAFKKPSGQASPLLSSPSFRQTALGQTMKKEGGEGFLFRMLRCWNYIL